MKLLVLTPTLGSSPWFPDTVGSVSALRTPVRHVVICPAAVSSTVAAAAPGATVLPQSRSGLYPALNEGWQAAGGDWDFCTWVNDDDVLCPEGFAAALDRLEADASVGVVYGRVRLIGSTGRDLGALPVARRGADLPALLARGIVPLAQPGTLIRRTVVEQLAGFAEGYRLAGDLDFFVRALAAGVRFGFVNRLVARFRLTAGQLSKDEATGEAEKARALQPLAHLSRRGAARALVRFRWENLGVYLDRIRRHGWVSMQTLARQG